MGLHGKTNSWDAIDETVRITFDNIGATTVILQTFPIFNNVINMEELRIVNKKFGSTQEILTIQA